MIAAGWRNFDAFDVILKNGGDINIFDNDGNNAAHFIAKHDVIDKRFLGWICQNEKLLTIKNKNGETALDILHKKEDFRPPVKLAKIMKKHYKTETLANNSII